MLACEVARPYMSAAWLDTSESMIVRKMRNNAIKKHPKDLNAIAKQSLMQMDETYQQTQEEIAENANTEDFPLSRKLSKLWKSQRWQRQKLQMMMTCRIS